MSDKTPSFIRLQGYRFREWVKTFKGRIIIDHTTKSLNGHVCLFLKHSPNQRKHIIIHWLSSEDQKLFEEGKLNYNEDEKRPFIGDNDCDERFASEKYTQPKDKLLNLFDDLYDRVERVDVDYYGGIIEVIKLSDLKEVFEIYGLNIDK